MYITVCREMKKILKCSGLHMYITVIRIQFSIPIAIGETKTLGIWVSVSAFAALLIGLVVGCFFGVCFHVLCHRDHKRFPNSGAVIANVTNKTNDTLEPSEANLTTQYEELDAVRTEYEFQLSENNAYSKCGDEDCTEIYDN